MIHESIPEGRVRKLQGWHVPTILRAVVIIGAPVLAAARTREPSWLLSGAVVATTTLLGAWVLARDAAPVRPDSTVCFGREQIDMFTLAGLLFGGGALWGLAGLIMSIGSQASQGFNACAFILCLVPIIPGLFWRQRTEVDFRSGTIRVYPCGRAFWKHKETPIQGFRVQLTTWKHRQRTKPGEVIPLKPKLGQTQNHILNAGVEGTDEGLFLGDYAPSNTEQQLRAHADRWDQFLNGHLRAEVNTLKEHR